MELEAEGKVDEAIELYEQDVGAGVAAVQPYHRLRIIYERRNEFVSDSGVPGRDSGLRCGPEDGEAIRRCERQTGAAGELGHDPACNAISMVTVRGQTPKACSNSSSSGERSSVHLYHLTSNPGCQTTSGLPGWAP